MAEPRCPFCRQEFTEEERGQMEFAPPHPANRLSGKMYGAACRGSGELLDWPEVDADGTDGFDRYGDPKARYGF